MKFLENRPFDNHTCHIGGRQAPAGQARAGQPRFMRANSTVMDHGQGEMEVRFREMSPDGSGS